jgi:hypothetical protein
MRLETGPPNVFAELAIDPRDRRAPCRGKPMIATKYVCLVFYAASLIVKSEAIK